VADELTTPAKGDLERFDMLISATSAVAAVFFTAAFDVDDYEMMASVDQLGRALAVTQALLRERMIP